MSFNLVLFKPLLIGKLEQLDVEKLLLIEKSIAVAPWDFSLKFSVAMSLSMLTERFGEVILE